MIVDGLVIRFRYDTISDGRRRVACFAHRESEPNIKWGESAICSLSDTYNKIKGRKMALTRLLTYFPKNLRTKVWNEYKLKCKYN